MLKFSQLKIKGEKKMTKQMFVKVKKTLDKVGFIIAIMWCVAFVVIVLGYVLNLLKIISKEHMFFLGRPILVISGALLLISLLRPVVEILKGLDENSDEYHQRLLKEGKVPEVYAKFSYIITYLLLSLISIWVLYHQLDLEAWFNKISFWQFVVILLTVTFSQFVAEKVKKYVRKFVEKKLENKYRIS